MEKSRLASNFGKRNVTSTTFFFLGGDLVGNNVFHGPPPAWETSSWKLAQGPGAFERWGGRTPKQRVPRALVPNARDPWRAQHKRSALRRPDLSLTGGLLLLDLQQQPAEYLESCGLYGKPMRRHACGAICGGLPRSGLAHQERGSTGTQRERI